MQKRICPQCSTRWYSANSSQIWKCDNCGTDIPVPQEDEIKEKIENKRGNNN